MLTQCLMVFGYRTEVFRIEQHQEKTHQGVALPSPSYIQVMHIQATFKTTTPYFFRQNINSQGNTCTLTCRLLAAGISVSSKPYINYYSHTEYLLSLSIPANLTWSPLLVSNRDISNIESREDSKGEGKKPKQTQTEKKMNKMPNTC